MESTTIAEIRVDVTERELITLGLAPEEYGLARAEILESNILRLIFRQTIGKRTT